ncbi:MAG TPA: antibiotic biosynthesis monooxygenase family protein [Holophagaceae bacterium]|nr:antibiotic biosynthesis monooxygenase family protein [Holophagaceae bacterium]
MNIQAHKQAKVLSARLTAHPGKQEELRQTLLGLRREILLQSGCLECTIGLDADDDSRFVIFMVWKGQAHLEAHLDSEAFRVLLGATHVLAYPAGFRYVATDTAFCEPDGVDLSQAAARPTSEMPSSGA